MTSGFIPFFFFLSLEPCSYYLHQGYVTAGIFLFVFKRKNSKLLMDLNKIFRNVHNRLTDRSFNFVDVLDSGGTLTFGALIIKQPISYIILSYYINHPRLSLWVNELLGRGLRSMSDFLIPLLLCLNCKNQRLLRGKDHIVLFHNLLLLMKTISPQSHFIIRKMWSVDFNFCFPLWEFQSFDFMNHSSFYYWWRKRIYRVGSLQKGVQFLG